MIIIFRGPSGSGKTTLANYLFNAGEMRYEMRDNHALADYLFEVRARIPMGQFPREDHLFSADDYFTDKKTGTYTFDPAMLSRAHGNCLQRFTDRLVEVPDKRIPLVVDNTNTTIAEVAPYAALAGAYEQELHVITLFPDIKTCIRRTLHGTPTTHIVKQQLQLEESIRQWPAWWPQQVFPC